MSSTTSRRQGRVGAVLRAVPAWAYVILSAAIVLPPVAWIVSTSLKTASDTLEFPPRWIPDPISFEGYAGLLTSTNIRFFV